MKIILTILLATTLATTTPNLVGVYEYKSIEKSENHYIAFDKVDGELKGKYFGTHDGKGHGVFFYKADIEKLKISTRGEIEFEIGDRLLYGTNQFKIKDPEPDSIIGRTREVLKYTGHITGDKIKLVCSSEFNDCWDKELTFDRALAASFAGQIGQLMTPEEFVKNFHKERQQLVDLYFDGQGQTDVSKMIQSLNLDDKKLGTLKEILMATLRDAFYTTLLGIDGAAQIGDRQEMYRLTDEQGNELTGGEIEGFAWEYFHNAKASS